ncbi:transglutaminase-like domain-containing protein, partial [Enterococcus faecium]
LPHIRFTPYLRNLADEIVGDESNPLKKARLIYDFVTTKIHYSFMREYFTISNISEYAATNLKGDCGVQAILFITLCRIAGIPA